MRNSTKRLSAKERLDIRAKIAAGKTDAEIAQETGRNRSTINRVRSRSETGTKTTNGKVLQTRLPVAEYERFREKMAGEGLTMSDGVRRLIRQDLDLVDLRSAEIEALNALRRELNAVGVNINQMVKLAQSGRLTWNARDAALVQKVDLRVEAVINGLISLVSAGRQRGMAGASDAMGSLDEV